MINGIVSLLGVQVSEENEEQMDEQIIELTKMIIMQFSNYCPEEIEEAFQMAVAGKFPEVELYQKLDGVIFSRVMKAYNRLRNPVIQQSQRLLISQPENEMSKEQHAEKNREACIDCFNNFIIHAYNSLLAKDGLDYEPFYNDYREWFGCDSLRYLGLFDIGKDIKDECWKKSESIALNFEKTRVEAAHMKGNILEKVTPKDLKGKRNTVYKHLCFWEQLVSWKIEGKELETIEN